MGSSLMALAWIVLFWRMPIEWWGGTSRYHQQSSLGRNAGDGNSHGGGSGDVALIRPLGDGRVSWVVVGNSDGRRY